MFIMNFDVKLIKYCIPYITFIIIDSLRCIHYIGFITWHSLHCIDYITFWNLSVLADCKFSILLPTFPGFISHGHYNKMAYDEFYSIFFCL